MNAELRQAIVDLLDSAYDEGCTPDLIVVGSAELRNLKEFIVTERLNECESQNQNPRS